MRGTVIRCTSVHWLSKTHFYASGQACSTLTLQASSKNLGALYYKRGAYEKAGVQEARSSQESSSSEDELPEAEQEFPDSGTVTPVILPASSQMPVSGVRMERSAAETLAYDFADL